MNRREAIQSLVAGATGGIVAEVKDIPLDAQFVAIEFPHALSSKQVEDLHASLAPFAKETGIKFLVLPGGAKLRTVRNGEVV